MKINTFNYPKIIMRISTFYIITVLGLHSLFASEINGQTLQSSTVEFDKSLYKLQELFRVIEDKTTYSFVLSEPLLDLESEVILSTKDQNLLHLLEKVSKEKHLRFYRINDLISVSRQDISEKGVSNVIQQREITGLVVDQEGVPLPGATIQINNTATGVVTDFNGNFTVNASIGDKLSITYVGFQPQSLVIGQDDFYNIELNQDVSQLDEVVVTALGIKRQEKKLGFSQETVKSEELAQTVPVNWSSGLKGKVAGLNIVSAGSGPINSQQIILRGNSSFDLSGNYALVVVDGVPVNTEMTTTGSGSAYMGEDSPI